jgi:hypothetical protein
VVAARLDVPGRASAVVAGLDVPVPSVVAGVVAGVVVPSVVAGVVVPSVVAGVVVPGVVTVVGRAVVAAGGERDGGGPAGQDQDGRGGQDRDLPHVSTFRGVLPLSVRPRAGHHRTVVLGPGARGHRPQ